MQVLDFLTSLSIAVYMELVRKKTGIPAATVVPQLEPKSKQVLGFGSRAARCGSAMHSTMPNSTMLAGTDSATDDEPSQAIKAEGQPVTLTKPLSSTQPRQRLPQLVPVFVIPAPAVHSPPGVAKFLRQKQSKRLC